MGANIWSPEDTISGVPTALLNKFIDLFTGDGVTTVFGPLTQDPRLTNNAEVYISGVRQTGNIAYSLVDNYIVFTEAPPAPIDDPAVQNIVVTYGVVASSNATTDDASQIIYTPPGTGALVTTVQAELARTLWVDNFGATGNWDPDTEVGTDDTGAFQRLSNYADFLGTAVIANVSAKHYLLSGTVTINSPILWKGRGFEDIVYPRVETCPKFGSWLIHDTDAPMFQSGGANCSGTYIDGIAVFETGHPPGSTAGWAPRNRGYIINWTTYGCRFGFGRVHFHGVNKAAWFDTCARIEFGQVSGQFFTNGLGYDRIYDSCNGDWIRAWTYRYEATPVLQYTQANSSTLALFRLDGLAFNSITTFAVRDSVYIGKSSDLSPGGGTARVIQIGAIYCDFSGRPITVTGGAINAEVSVGQIFHLGQAWPPTPVQPIAGACTILLEDTSNSVIHVGYIRSNLVPSAAIGNGGSGNGNVVEIGVAYFTAYDFVNGGNGAVATSVNNTVQFAHPPICVSYSGGNKITSIADGPINSTVQAVEVIAADNRIWARTSQGGNPTQLFVAGPNNTDLQLVPAGTGMVRFGAKTVNADAPITGYVLHKLADGTTVKLAIIA